MHHRGKEHRCVVVVVVVVVLLLVHVCVCVCACVCVCVLPAEVFHQDLQHSNVIPRQLLDQLLDGFYTIQLIIQLCDSKEVTRSK